MCILVVDDDDLVRGTAVMVLEEAGYDTLEAGDVPEALALLRSDAARITHVFTDVRMPGWQDGIDLAMLIREQHPHIGVVITSGYHDRKIEALDHCVRFLPKPWTTIDVLNVVVPNG